MKKLSTEQENAARDVARQCSIALKKAITENPSAGWNSIATPILHEYHEKVKPMGVSLMMFYSIIGRLNGRFGRYKGCIGEES
ncbi:hypothetical protein R4R82_001134 [Enterobacter asburiae]|nr:hypothetical protein [Enterobacter asburiae]